MTASGLADGLALAATPCFGTLAFLAAIGGAPADLCSAGGLPFVGGMATMYGLMALFHAAPWLRLVGRIYPLNRPASASALRARSPRSAPTATKV